MKKIEIELLKWEIKELKERGLDMSKLLEDLVAIYLGGKPELLEVKYNGEDIKDSILQVKRYDEKVIQTILKIFEDIEYKPERLKGTVNNVDKAVSLRLYVGVPKRLHHNISKEYIDYLIKHNERLIFLRPFIMSEN